MHNTSFQFVFIAVLAGGLGYSVASSRAESYPAGAAISLGQNPVVSAGGRVNSETQSVFTAPADHQIIVTDVILSYHNGNCHPELVLTTSSGKTLGQFRLYQDNDSDKTTQPSSIQHAFQSGLPLPQSEQLYISESSGCNVTYTISGYMAQP